MSVDVDYSEIERRLAKQAGVSFYEPPAPTAYLRPFVRRMPLAVLLMPLRPLRLATPPAPGTIVVDSMHRLDTETMMPGDPEVGSPAWWDGVVTRGLEVAYVPRRASMSSFVALYGARRAGKRMAAAEIGKRVHDYLGEKLKSITVDTVG